MQKHVILDATLLSSLMSCGRLTDFRFNHNFQPVSGKSSSLEMGSLVHTILEYHYRAIIAGAGRVSAIELGIQAGKNYEKEEMKNTEEKDIKLAYDTIDQYFDFYKNDSWIPIEVEYVKQEVIYEDSDLKILWKAKLDLTVDTNNGIYPVDHKTMKSRRDSLSLNNQFMGQCIVMKSRSVIIDKIGFQTSLKPHEKFSRPMVSYSANRLVEWSQVIVPYWANLMLYYDETGYWPPNFTHCENKFGFCQFRSICESDTNMREEELRINFEIGEVWNPSNSPNSEEK